MQLKINIFLLSAVLLLSACENIKTRRQLKPQTEPVIEGSMQEVTPEQPEEEKIALILGAGGLKTIAHAGVLQAFEQEKLPIVHIIGLGLASIEGGMYAVSNSATSLQWQMKKWRKDDFASVGFLSKRFEAKSTGPWLEKLIAKKQLGKKTSDFSCPSRSYITGKLRWVKNTRLKRALSDCASVAPLASSSSQWVGAPEAIEAAILRLRRIGVSKIVFVNVLSKRAHLFTQKQLHNNQGDAMYWQSIRSEYSNLRKITKKYEEVKVLNVNVGSQPLLNYRNFNVLNNEGLKAAKRFIKEEL